MKCLYFIGVALTLFLDGDTADPIELDIACGLTEYDPNERIVGGQIAAKGQFPWLVSIKVHTKQKDMHNCGGVIIHPSFILSAAHCAVDFTPSDLVIVAGDFDMEIDEDSEQKRNVSNFFFNKYNKNTYKNDLVLLKLSDPFHFVPNEVVPICLPIKDVTYSDKAQVAGWGRIKENGNLPRQLQWVELSIISNETCRKQYNDRKYNTLLHECQICTFESKKDACQGDSGGPLINHEINPVNNNRSVVQGVVSWGAGCARPQFPGVYTDVIIYDKI